MRLDIYVSAHLQVSRNRAQRIIEEGLVRVDGMVSRKASFEVEKQMITVLDGTSNHWVSRSAGKLDGFLDEIGSQGGSIDIHGMTCLDIGSSTGGFTQILLERGATRVVAVDVGTHQLHESLRGHANIELHEMTDIRKFSQEEIFDVISIDVSFISLREIIPTFSRFSKAGTQILLLFKPQFEVGREHLRKTGVPKNEKIVQDTLVQFSKFLGEQGYLIKKISKATVIGEAGNQEYMIWMIPDGERFSSKTL